MTFFTAAVSWFFVLLAFSLRWMLKTWGNLKMDEMMYTIGAPVSGTNPEMLRDFRLVSLYPSVIILVLFLCAVFYFSRRHSEAGDNMVRKLRRGFLAFGLSASVLMIFVTLYRLEGFTYIRQQFTPSSFIEEQQAETSSARISFPEKKRNLVYLYLESMEVTYMDAESGGAFPENVIPELTALAREGEDFSGNSREVNGAVSLASTTWTSAGLFAQASGLPLKLGLLNRIWNFGESPVEKFFPTVVTLGDLLEEAGYQQCAMIGSDARFGGRKEYFERHGNLEIYDYHTAAETGMIPEGYHVWWGFEDEKLFDAAKQKLTELSEGGKPFALTLLTADTHFEDGYVCRLCRDDFGNNRYANVMACSARQVAAFVDWLKEQPFYENTTVIIAGDHPTMDKDFCRAVPRDYERRVAVSILNAPKTPADPDAVRHYSTFDLFPTTLSAMGAEIEGSRLGLGVDLYSETPTLLERYDKAYLQEEIGRRSDYMERMSRVREY